MSTTELPPIVPAAPLQQPPQEEAAEQQPLNAEAEVEVVVLPPVDALSVGDKVFFVASNLYLHHKL